MELELKISQRMEQLRKERDAYIIEVNKNIVAYNAAIAELERLLQPEQGATHAG